MPRIRGRAVEQRGGDEEEVEAESGTVGETREPRREGIRFRIGGPGVVATCGIYNSGLFPGRPLNRAGSVPALWAILPVQAQHYAPCRARAVRRAGPFGQVYRQSYTTYFFFGFRFWGFKWHSPAKFNDHYCILLFFYL